MQEPSKTAELILYIVDQLNDMGRRPSTIQLVKYLYLIDIEHQRSLRRPLTGLKWVYHRFGPYAFELPTIAKRLGFDLSSEKFSAEKAEGRYFEAGREAPFPEGFGYASQSVVDRILTIWGLASTREILDHVYFNTEPMVEAAFGDVLDISLAKPDIGAYQVEFHNTKQLGELRARFEADRRETGRVRKRLSMSPDTLFIKTMENLDRTGE